MLNEAQREELRIPLRTMQIIVGVLALGVLNFLAVVLFITGTSQDQPKTEPFLSYIGAAGAALVIVVSMLVPRLMGASARRSFSAEAKSTSVRPLASAYQTLLIIRCALLEGAAFFCLVAHLLERQPIALVAAGVLLLVLVANFPTASRLEAWVETELTS